ncbi:MAG TPA: DUF2071 domain-containing protein [Planctomycetota bacterium]|jgi:hypothetical protein|nr:DUF2071 domain-containing protein [Planctomycetota bacterium]
MTSPFDPDRPWPPPARPWDLAMRWSDLLFLHWPIDAALLRPKIPRELALDAHSGSAWIGVVPFRMSNVRLRGLPGAPGFSAFPEANVRTYVTHGGKPGVWFFSLDAASRLAVRVARARFHLPYFDARMRCVAHAGRDGGTVEYATSRTHAGAPPAELRARWRATGPVQLARAGTLEHFLTARFCLYARRKDGQVVRGDVDHPDWPLQVAEVEVETNTMLAAHGLATPDVKPLAHAVEQLDVVAWRPVEV